jgi:hypothetical protein
MTHDVDTRSMIGGISQGADLTRSLDALAAMLQNSQDQAMQLADKMLKAGVQQAVQDAAIGTLIDTSA